MLACRSADGLGFAARARQSDDVDAHAWMFMPSSFDLRAMGLLALSIEVVEEADDAASRARLRPCEEIEDAETVHRHRRGLLNRIVVEQAESARQVDPTLLQR